MSKIKHFAVMGKPVAHSLSPYIQNNFAKQCGLIIDYRTIEVSPSAFNQRCLDFFSRGGCGLNITTPLKNLAFKLAKHHSLDAKKAGAANTLSLDENQQLFSDNTDGKGFVADLLSHGELTEKRVLLIGAGGAASGVINPLLTSDIASLHIANRTEKKLETLLDRFPELTTSTLQNIDGVFDIVINASSASLKNELLEIDSGLLSGALCYDMVYGKKALDTVFCQHAKKAGASLVLDGWGMLTRQAAESFFLWHGQYPKQCLIPRPS